MTEEERAAYHAGREARSKLAGRAIGKAATMFHGEHVRVTFAALVAACGLLIAAWIILFSRGGPAHPVRRPDSFKGKHS